VSGNLRHYRRYQRFPVYPVGVPRPPERRRRRVPPKATSWSRVGAWIIRRLGG